MIDFDKLNVGDKVIVKLGFVAYNFGYNRNKWSLPHMIVDSVTNKKKTQFTTSGGFRFSRHGVSVKGDGVRALPINSTGGWSSDNPLIDSILSNDVIDAHKEKIKKITKAQCMLDMRYGVFRLHELNNIDDAVTVADSIISAAELMSSLLEAQSEK